MICLKARPVERRGPAGKDDRRKALMMIGHQESWLLWLLAFSVISVVSLLPSAQAASSSGCMAAMFITAGVSQRQTNKYEISLATNGVPVSNVRMTPPFLLRLFGVSNLRHAVAFHNCHTSNKRNLKCNTFRECSGHGHCKLHKPRRKSEAHYRCDCAAGYFGSRCETDACLKTCQNGGSCKRTQRGGRFQCTCKPGYIGKRCEKTLNRCNPNPCANGGLCRPLHNDFSCTCKYGHAGKRCQSHVLTEKELDKKLSVLAKAIKDSGQYQLYRRFMSIFSVVAIWSFNASTTGLARFLVR